LTDQDLEKLGVLLGHRRKMLRAIAELANARTPKPQLVGDVGTSPETRPNVAKSR
jgi:hypothetical protein